MRAFWPLGGPQGRWTLTIAETAPVPAAGCVSSEFLPWAEMELPSGIVGAKLLRVSDAAGSFTVLSRMPAGVEIPRHRHLGDVHAFTHKGTWRYREYDWIAAAGSYVYEPPGSTHTLEVLEDMETTFVIAGGQIMLGPSDEVLAYEDFTTARALYRDMLKSQGIDYPAKILS